MDEGVVLDLGLITSLVFLAVLLALSVYWEMKEHRIPNWLTVSGMLAGLMLAYLRGGETLISSLVGLGIGFGFLFIFYVFGGIGGGDVKLMGAIGALLGHKLVVPALFYTAVIGAFMAVVVLIWRRTSPSRSAKTTESESGMPAVEGAAPPIPEADQKPGATIPYGVAMAAGSIMALLIGS